MSQKVQSKVQLSAVEYCV